MTRKNIVSKIHLIISVTIVIPAALIYGFSLGHFLNLSPNTIDEQNFHKALMGLYLSFSFLWILGVFKDKYLKPALISNCVFMCGLAFGRLTSIIIDGFPSMAYLYGTIGEFILGFYGLWVLKLHHHAATNP